MPDRPAPPSTKVYSQKIPDGGYGYLRTRDGTSLAIDVRLPGPAVEPARTRPWSSTPATATPTPPAPRAASAPSPTSSGFAVVDVNMRGTGCSGGSFDYFEPLQSLDGYDVIETVARQPWVLGHRVGMLGISYGGISQLFVGATDPPHLAAIAPLSVIDNTATTLYPGGILNTGFALGWAEERQSTTPCPPRATGGQPWAFKRIQQGDQTCKANQVLHGEAPNVVGQVRANHYFVPSVANPLAPITFVHKIHVPVYLACQFTDEQTGGHCADLAAALHRHRRASGSRSPTASTSTRWTRRRSTAGTTSSSSTWPTAGPQLSRCHQGAGAHRLLDRRMGISDVTLPPDPIQSEPTYAAALSAFQALKPIRVLFDNGAGSSTPGAPYPGVRAVLLALPDPRARRRGPGIWQAAGRSAPARPRRPSSDEFTWKPKARPATSFTGDDGGSAGGLWNATPAYHWQVNPAGTAASYVSAPLSANTVVIGGGRGAAVDQGLGARAWTSRRRSPRCAPTARRRSCRTAGCAPPSASSTPRRARCSRRC